MEIITLSSTDIIQINATIITGLLILLTFQSVTAVPTIFSTMEETSKKLDDLYIEDKKLTSLLFFYEDEYQNLLSSYDSSDRLKYIQSKIDDLSFRQKEAKLEYNLLNDELTSLQDFSYLLGFIKSENIVRSVGMLMIIPFSISAVAETVISIRRKKENTDASKLGTSLMIAGFIVLIFGVLIIIGTLQIESDSVSLASLENPLSTSAGNVPLAQDSRVSQNLIYDLGDTISDNTIISTTYKFSISAPDIENWELENDESKLHDKYDYLVYPGAHIAAEIDAKHYDENGNWINVLVFVEEKNDLSPKQNLEELKTFLIESENEKFKASEFGEFYDDEGLAAVLVYNLYACDFADTEYEDCYESLEVETFVKVEDKLYNVRGSISPDYDDPDQKLPDAIPTTLYDIMGSFELI